jgi:hypothetical protein
MPPMPAKSKTFGNQFNPTSERLVVRFQHSHPLAAGTFANVGIKGPPENI